MAEIYTRSVKEEIPKPISGKLTGTIPSWLKGSLLRNGPGLKKFGNMEMNHLFDGLSLLHRFNISDGNVTYQNQFLKSQSYKRDTAANMIVMTEFGTRGVPDPCQSVFSRYFSYFFPQLTDNDNVNLIPYGGNAIYAVTETTCIHKIDPVTLDTEERIDLSKYINLRTATAHPHIDKDGSAYNVGTRRDRNGLQYCFLKFPKVTQDEKLSTFEQAQIISILKSTTSYMNYYHSFGMTENYFIFLEQPLVINLKVLLVNYLIKRLPIGTAMEWKPNEQVHINLINRNTGEHLAVNYVADPSFTFHHINAFEDNGFAIFDVCCAEDASIINFMSLENLRQKNPFQNVKYAQARRYVLPLNISLAKIGTNLVDLNYTTATAVRLENDSIYLTPEILNQINFDLPRINYDFNGIKYRYVYGVTFKTEPFYQTGLLKLDTMNKTEEQFYYPGNFPSEPVFISRPNSSEEDDGVILSSVLTDDPLITYLVILDGKSFTEVARVEFNAEISTDFHGIFIPEEDELSNDIKDDNNKYE